LDLSDIFGINQRVKAPKLMSKQVTSKFCWWVCFFTAFYAVFSKKYCTRGFIAKTFVVLLILVLINFGLSYLFDDTDWLWNLIEGIYVGTMFNTWYYHQLINNGYQETVTNQSTEFE